MTSLLLRSNKVILVISSSIISCTVLVYWQKISPHMEKLHVCVFVRSHTEHYVQDMERGVVQNISGKLTMLKNLGSLN